MVKSANEDDIEPERNPSIIERHNSNASIRSFGQVPNQMTVQLVLPNQFGGPRVVDDPHGFDTLTSVNRRSRPPSRTNSILESKSPGFINTRLVNYNRGLSHQPSLRSQRPEPHANIPPPSSEEEKSKMTRRYFATIIAICYAIFLVIFALIAFIGDAVTDQENIVPQVFSIFMLVVGLCYFIFLYIDIRLHVNKARNAVKIREEQAKRYEEQIIQMEENFQSSLELRQTANGNVVQIPIPDIMMDPPKKISHRYCFATGRHGEFLYLKLGAAWFCFGLLIHSILNIVYEALYLVEDPECFDPLQFSVDVMFPIYSLLLLFFIFKYCNIIINSFRGVARVLFMHAIGTSLAFWIFTIVRETVDIILIKREAYDNYFEWFLDANGSPAYKSNSTRYAYQTNEEEDRCPNELNTIRRTLSPYLYPFVIEFCILIVGIFYMMWANINHCPKKHHGHGNAHAHGSSHGSHQELQHSHSQNKLVHNHSFSNLHTIAEEHHRPNGNLGHHRPPSVASDHCNTLVDHDSSEYKSSIIVYADCTKSSRGLFAGMCILILIIVFIILLHVAARNPDYVDTGVLIDRIFYLTIMCILIMCVVAGYIQTSKLDINPHPIGMLDDVLLFIAIPAFFSETIFSMLPAVILGSYLNVAIIMAQLIQILLQTPWIIDALRRCSNSEELRKKKPGRELVIFLTISNVALWVYYTFSVKTLDTQDERYEFYSYVLWSILNHISLPLIMFYRFHASVCLVDVWRHSYEPGEFPH